MSCPPLLHAGRPAVLAVEDSETTFIRPSVGAGVRRRHLPHQIIGDLVGGVRIVRIRRLGLDVQLHDALGVAFLDFQRCFTRDHFVAAGVLHDGQ